MCVIWHSTCVLEDLVMKPSGVLPSDCFKNVCVIPVLIPVVLISSIKPRPSLPWYSLPLNPLLSLELYMYSRIRIPLFHCCVDPLSSALRTNTH